MFRENSLDVCRRNGPLEKKINLWAWSEINFRTDFSVFWEKIFIYDKNLKLMVHEVLNFVHIKINSRVFSLQQFHIQFFFQFAALRLILKLLILIWELLSKISTYVLRQLFQIGVYVEIFRRFTCRKMMPQTY